MDEQKDRKIEELTSENKWLVAEYEAKKQVEEELGSTISSLRGDLEKNEERIAKLETERHNASLQLETDKKLLEQLRQMPTGAAMNFVGVISRLILQSHVQPPVITREEKDEARARANAELFFAVERVRETARVYTWAQDLSIVESQLRELRQLEQKISHLSPNELPCEGTTALTAASPETDSSNKGPDHAENAPSTAPNNADVAEPPPIAEKKVAEPKKSELELLVDERDKARRAFRDAALALQSHLQENDIIDMLEMLVKLSFKMDALARKTGCLTDQPFATVSGKDVVVCLENTLNAILQWRGWEKERGEFCCREVVRCIHELGACIQQYGAAIANSTEAKNHDSSTGGGGFESDVEQFSKKFQDCVSALESANAANTPEALTLDAQQRFPQSQLAITIRRALSLCVCTTDCVMRILQRRADILEALSHVKESLSLHAPSAATLLSDLRKLFNEYMDMREALAIAELRRSSTEEQKALERRKYKAVAAAFVAALLPDLNCLLDYYPEYRCQLAAFSPCALYELYRFDLTRADFEDAVPDAIALPLHAKPRGRLVRSRGSSAEGDAPQLLVEFAASECAAFTTECLVMSRLRHPHIASGLAAAFCDPLDRRFYVLEPCFSVTLSDWLQVNSRTPASCDVLRVATQAADGLAALHECGLVHCSLTPNTIVMSSIAPNATPRIAFDPQQMAAKHQASMESALKRSYASVAAVGGSPYSTLCAPEIMQSIKSGSRISSLTAVDVFSLCSIFQAAFASLASAELHDVLAKGMAGDPAARPSARMLQRTFYGLWAASLKASPGQSSGVQTPCSLCGELRDTQSIAARCEGCWHSVCSSCFSSYVRICTRQPLFERASQGLALLCPVAHCKSSLVYSTSLPIGADVNEQWEQCKRQTSRFISVAEFHVQCRSLPFDPIRKCVLEIVFSCGSLTCQACARPLCFSGSLALSCLGCEASYCAWCLKPFTAATTAELFLHLLECPCDPRSALDKARSPYSCPNETYCAFCSQRQERLAREYLERNTTLSAELKLSVQQRAVEFGLLAAVGEAPPAQTPQVTP